MKRRAVLAAPFCAFLLFACSDSEADMSDKPNTDIVILEKFIPLNPKPDVAQWSVLEEAEGLAPGPTDSALVALLSYAASDYSTVEKALTDGGPSDGGLMREAPKWLPLQVTQSAMKAVEEGFDFGTRAVSAKPFFSSPYLGGFAVTYPSERKVLVYLVTK